MWLDFHRIVKLSYHPRNSQDKNILQQYKNISKIKYKIVSHSPPSILINSFFVPFLHIFQPIFSTLYTDKRVSWSYWKLSPPPFLFSRKLCRSLFSVCATIMKNVCHFPFSRKKCVQCWIAKSCSATSLFAGT